jgi:hypothetical protein
VSGRQRVVEFRYHSKGNPVDHPEASLEARRVGLLFIDNIGSNLPGQTAPIVEGLCMARYTVGIPLVDVPL